MALLSIARGYIWFLHNTPLLQVVRGTLNALAAPVQDMGINHRGFHVLMAEEFLDCPNIIALFQKIGRPDFQYSNSILSFLGMIYFCRIAHLCGWTQYMV